PTGPRRYRRCASARRPWNRPARCPPARRPDHRLPLLEAQLVPSPRVPHGWRTANGRRHGQRSFPCSWGEDSARRLGSGNSTGCCRAISRFLEIAAREGPLRTRARLFNVATDTMAAQMITTPPAPSTTGEGQRLSHAVPTRARSATRPTSGGRWRWWLAALCVASIALAVAWQLRPSLQGRQSTASQPTHRPPAALTAPPGSVGVAQSTPPPIQITTAPASVGPSPRAGARAVVKHPPADANNRIATFESEGVPAPTPAAKSAAVPPANPPPVPDAGNTSQGQLPAARAATTQVPDPAADDSNEADLARDGAAPAGFGDEPIDDVPPATADAPTVRDAWLERIRALVDGGDLGDARQSLRAFTQRYPDYQLPADLRTLQ
ncbi:MAG: hypothetical protein JWL98_2204, partial [Xanthomonadaceae bacterium]|nr:hypothetical protein [Xanthomonadaceae bacterium]